MSEEIYSLWNRRYTLSSYLINSRTCHSKQKKQNSSKSLVPKNNAANVIHELYYVHKCIIEMGDRSRGLRKVKRFTFLIQ